MVTITKAFKWSPNGFNVETINAGEHEELPGRAVVIAGELGVLAGAEINKPAEEPEKKPSKRSRKK